MPLGDTSLFSCFFYSLYSFHVVWDLALRRERLKECIAVVKGQKGPAIRVGDFHAVGAEAINETNILQLGILT